MSGGLRQKAALWASRWGEDPSLFWKLFYEQGEQVVTLVALFLGKGRVEGRTHTTGHVHRPGVGTD